MIDGCILYSILVSSGGEKECEILFPVPLHLLSKFKEKLPDTVAISEQEAYEKIDNGCFVAFDTQDMLKGKLNGG